MKGDRIMSDYYNTEYSEDIVCPYCGEVYEPSYEDTWIGDEYVDCYTEEEQICTCSICGKKFKLQGEPIWKYDTVTIDGEMSEEEWEEEWEETFYNSWRK